MFTINVLSKITPEKIYIYCVDKFLVMSVGDYKCDNQGVKTRVVNHHCSSIVIGYNNLLKLSN